MSQEQQVNKDSTAIQSGRDTIIVQQGISVTEARQIAIDVFEQNFQKLAGIARAKADERAQQVTDKFLEQLQKENPDGLLKAHEPGFQYDIFTVQKEYAKNGDPDLGALLVDLLLDRSKTKERDILQIVLSESLKTAPKLTIEQLASLAIVFLFRYTQNPSISSHDELGKHFDRCVLPFVGNLSKSDSCYQHLQFAGCGSIEVTSLAFAMALMEHYQGLFLKGLDTTQLAQYQIPDELKSLFVGRCLNDASKLQISYRCKEELNKALDNHKVSPDHRGRILEAFERERMTPVEIKDKCISIKPYMEKVFDVWDSSAMKSFVLTSVGIAIGHANIKRFVGEFADLKIWIN